MKAFWRLELEADEGRLLDYRRAVTRLHENRVVVSMPHSSSNGPDGPAPTLPSLTARIADWGRADSFETPRGISLTGAPEPVGPFRGPYEASGDAGGKTYRILIDDTGSRWAGEEPDGRLVAVVCRKDLPLPNVHSDFHATRDPDVAMRLVRWISQAPVGILGLWASRLPYRGEGERWLMAVLELVRQVVLLLPGSPRRVEVAIEQHAGIDPGFPTDALEDALRVLLIRTRPDLHVELSVQIFAKGCFWPLHLADSLAWAWHRAFPVSQGGGRPAPPPDAAALALLAPAMEAGFLPSATEVGAIRFLDTVIGSPEWPVRTWEKLALEPTEHRLARHLLSLVETRAAGRQECIDRAILSVQRTLYGRRYQFDALLRTLDSFDRLRPDGAADLPPDVTLLIQASRLAAHTRLGGTASAHEHHIASADLALWGEDFPEAACELALRLAVCHTNALDWSAARRILHAAPTALPRLWRARLLSSHAQLLANEGQDVAAAEGFVSALRLFDAISGQSVSADRAQTRSYLFHLRFSSADASIHPSAAEAREDLQSAYPLLVNGPAQIFRESRDAGAYRLLDTLRWMLYYPEDTHRERDLLLDLSEDWHRTTHHPWPLIELYRALILAPVALPESLVDGLLWAEDVTARVDLGPALHLQNLCITAVRLLLQGERTDPILTERAHALRLALPSAGVWVDRILGMVAENPPVEELSRVLRALPFSFR